MKKLLSILLFAIFCISLCACQPTPDKPFVESKNDGELEAAVYGEAVPELANGYDAPETWVEDIDGLDDITIFKVNAKITVPDATRYPVYRVVTTDITNEDADKFIQAFIGDQQLYSLESDRTKAVIQEEIDNILKEYEDPDSLTNRHLLSGELSQEEYEYYREQDDERIRELQTEYKNAPYDIEISEIKREFETLTDSYGGSYKILSGVVTLNGEIDGYISISTESNSPHGYGQSKLYSHMLNDSMTTLEGFVDKHQNLNDMVLSYEDAKAIADKQIYEKLQYTDYSLNRVCAERYMVKDFDDVKFYVDGHTNSELPERYVFIYTPVIDGIPLQYYSYGNSHALAYSEYITPYYVTVTVQSKDEYTVIENSTMKITDTLNTNVSLLPFEEIQDIFRRYIAMSADSSDTSNGLDEEGNLIAYSITYNITDIRLGYVRIIEKDNISRGLLVPVWNFYGQQVNHYIEGANAGWVLNENNEKVFDTDVGNAFLSINAVDGSVIDLDLGY